MDDLLSDLNPQQAAAVTHRGKPILVVAGAGSGKTRVLTRRIAHLLAEGQAVPSEILAITFTNKAAAEMKDRVTAHVGPVGQRMWVSTFHSACVRILRRQAHHLGFPSSFSIYDTDDSRRLITNIGKDLDLDPRKYRPRGLQHQISGLKNELIDHESFVPETEAQEVLAEVFRLYTERLHRAGAMDFDDLIGNTVAVLTLFDEVAAYYHRLFAHILIDEYQDTNRAQYELVRRLVGQESGGLDPAELCVVGDSDQSIYAFRGADVRNIEEFEKDFPGAEVVLLEQNYRSTQTILSAANALIAHNAGRRDKRLWTDAGDGAKIVGYVGDDDRDEAAFVVNEIKRLTADGLDPGEIAIFYRTHAQSRPLEEVLLRSGLRYRIVGNVRFYERKEVRDALAYLRVISNPEDDVALTRILNVPKRGLGDRTVEQISQLAAREQITFEAALRRREEAGIGTRSDTRIGGFLALLDELRMVLDSGADPEEMVEAVLEQSGLVAELQASNDPQDESRLENLAELASVAREFVNDNADGQLADFLERVALVAEADDVPAHEGGLVTLMTLHTAKGLEFDAVFLTGLEESVFPHARSLDDPKEMEEERRLAYVGVTRARKQLHVSRASMRMQFGTPQANPPSRFLEELPADLVDWRRTGRDLSRRPSAGGRGAAPALAQAAGSARRTSGPILSLTAGDNVLHPKFGLGTVVSTAGSADKAEAHIDFGSEGVKRLLLRYAPVEKV
ncbi:MAG: DNA helicase PcrA [Candidatus Nanopelagicales bacterium]|nr:DNA helicase PcrA [Candidatus Nanopelagicales bacterium]